MDRALAPLLVPTTGRLPAIPGGLQGPAVISCLPCEQERPSIERYIATIFHAAYGATVMEYLPLLCGLQAEGSYQAALGLRGAGQAGLFCEQYLDDPVETWVRREFGRNVPRSQIMELGNLVSSQPGQSVFLYLLVVRALERAGVNYLLFAANRAVRYSIRRCGFSTRELGAAEAERLGPRAAEWGSYYQGQPRVLLGDLRQGVQHGLGNPCISAIWDDNEDAIDELTAAIAALRG